jgi:uncharacterized protein
MKLFPPLMSLAWFLATPLAMAGSLEDGKAAFAAGIYADAVAAFGEGMKAGDADSAYFLGRMLELGLGVPPDVSAALRLYRQAADSGQVEALNRVALMHYRGEAGVRQDYAEAARLFGQAAEQGDANALYNVGKLYLEGKGVARDAARALDYYRRAAEKNHILALNTLGALYRDGATGDADRAMAREYFARSAAFGNAVGLFETARMILAEGTDEEGTGPDRLVEAHTYLNLASARSHPNAPEALQELTALMPLADVALAQQKARAFVARTEAEE